MGTADRQNRRLGRPSRLTAALLVLLLVGLAHLVSAAGTHNDIEGRSAAAGKVTSAPFDYFHVPSSGLIADATFRIVAKTQGPTAIAKQLADTFSAAQQGSRAVAISGPSEAKTVQVITDALGLLRDVKLPLLTVIYVGSDSYGKAVEKAVLAAGAHYTFAPYP